MSKGRGALATPLDIEESGVAGAERAAGWAGPRERLLRMAKPLSAVVVVLLFWQYGLASGRVGIPGIPVRYLGSPSGIWGAFLLLWKNGYNGESLLYNVGVSVARVLIGFAIGSVVAVPLGLVMGYKRWVGETLGPIFGFLRPIPALAFVPVVVIWFGVSEVGIIFVIAITAFLYGVIGSASAIETLPLDYLRAADNFKVPGRVKLALVVLPGALPSILVSLRTSMALSWVVLVAAELISAQNGLGYIIENASTFFEINTVYVGIIFIGAIGVLMDIGFRWAVKRGVQWEHE